jgi:hypothetical protein
MERILQLLNEMESQGLIRRYAIGGGMAVMFYAEPVLTQDIDIFVLLPPTDEPIIVLTPLHDFFRQRGYQFRGLHLEVEGWLVQFLPATSDLEIEAVQEAIEVPYGSTSARVMRAEYIIAIKLQVGRARDLFHIQMLLQQAKIDHDYLQGVLERYGLKEKWQAFIGEANRS